jgi:hypothetical protein
MNMIPIPLPPVVLYCAAHVLNCKTLPTRADTIFGIVVLVITAIAVVAAVVAIYVTYRK